MPRPKGSKNKKKVISDVSASLAEKMQEKASLEAEQQEIGEQLEELKARAKVVKKSLTAVGRSIAKLESKQAEAEAAKAKQEQMDKLDAAVSDLADRGISVDDILEALSKM